jgi:serine/threonine protein kinase/Flp pilus assembly protein TadD
VSPTPDDPRTSARHTGRGDSTRPDPNTPDAQATPTEAVRVAPLGAAPDVLPTVPGYEVTGEVGRGGMGVVYRVRDRGLERDLAVKVMLADPAARPEQAERFVAEAKLTAGLQHPGVVPVHQVGRLADGRPFFVMKLVRGRTLAERLATRPDPAADLPALLDVLAAVCRTVGFAHSRNVIHRDVKPHNVMVGDFGEVQVMDWGLARSTGARGRQEGGATDGSPELQVTDPLPLAADPAPGEAETLPLPAATPGRATRPGSVLGTPEYMSPEQARGEWDRVDARSDVFALGAVLCEILTGDPPYGSGTQEVVLFRAAEAVLAPARDALAKCGADAELVEIAARCLAPDPADRPADGTAVAALVDAYRAGVAERLRVAERERAAAEARAAEQRRKRRWQLAAAAAALLLLAAGGAFAWWSDVQATERRHEHEREEREAAARREEAAREVRSSLDACEDALRAENAPLATAAFDRAASRVSEAGDDSRDRLERRRGDVNLLGALDRADDLWWTVGEGQYSRDQAIETWAAAFRRFGIVPGTTPPAEAARLLNESLIRERALMELDLWSATGSAPAELLDVLKTVDPDPYRDEIRAAFRAKNRERFRELASSPKAAEQPTRFLVMIGQSYLTPNTRGELLIEAAFRKAPNNYWVLMILGSQQSPLNNPDTVEEKLRAEARLGWARAALVARPTSQAAWSNLGGALSGAGETEKAFEFTREAIRLDPKLPHPHNNLGLLYWRSGNIPAAIASLQEAARLDPHFPLPHYGIGNIRMAARDWPGAAAAFRDAIKADPNYTPGHNNLAVVLEQMGKPDEAAAEYHAVLKINPRDSQARYNLGVIHARKGEEDKAIECFREAIAIAPDYMPAHFNLGRLLEGQEQLEEAIRCYRKVIELKPDVPQAYSQLCVALQKQGKLDEAVAVARQGIKATPKFALTHNNLGYALEAQGKLEEAIAAYRASLEIDPSLTVAKINLQRALRRLDHLAPPPREVKR